VNKAEVISLSELMEQTLPAWEIKKLEEMIVHIEDESDVCIEEINPTSTSLVGSFSTEKILSIEGSMLN
jgi:hypothetical protein